MAATIRFVGPAGELHSSRRSFRAERESIAIWPIYGTNGLRPDVRRHRIAVAARGARGRMPDARRPADARRAGRAAIRVVDGQQACGRRDAGCGFKTPPPRTTGW